MSDNNEINEILDLDQQQVESTLMSLIKTGLIKVNFVFKQEVEQRHQSQRGVVHLHQSDLELPVLVELYENEPYFSMMNKLQEANERAKKIKEKLKWFTTNPDWFESLRWKVQYYEKVEKYQSAFS